MGLQTNRTESKSRVLINSQRSVSVARIVIEKDLMLFVKSVVWVSNLRLKLLSNSLYHDQVLGDSTL